MEMIIAGAALIFVLANLALGVALWLKVRKLYAYPGLLGLPVIGNLYYFYRTLLLISKHSLEKYMIDIAEKYGKDGICFAWGYGYRTLVIITSPHIVKEVGHHPDLADKPFTMYGGLMHYVDGAFGRLNSDDVWKGKRKIYNTALKKSHVDSTYYDTFNKCADKLIDSLLASASAIDAGKKAIGMTQDVTMETLFGVKTNLVYEPQLVNIMHWMTYLEGLIAANPAISRIILIICRLIDEKLFRKLGEWRKLILEYCSSPERRYSTGKYTVSEKDFCLGLQLGLSILKSNENNKKRNIMDLEPELHEMYLAASLSPANTLSSSLVFLAVLPDVQERAWKEQYEIFGDDKTDPSIDDLKDMHYLDRFIKEVLRFAAIPIIGKLATEDININGITIPRGANVFYLSRYMRLNPKYWKNPEDFDPDRFLEESDTLKYSYSPFGIGIRSCPAMYYSTVMLKIALSKIIRRLKLKPIQENFQFKDIYFNSGLTAELGNPPVLQVEERT